MPGGPTALRTPTTTGPATTASAATTLAVLWGLKGIERSLPRRARANLVVAEPVPALGGDLTESDLGLQRLRILDRRWDSDKAQRITRYEVRFGGPVQPILDRLEAVATERGLACVEWTEVET